MTYLASAHGDENGKAHGGVAGDQTGQITLATKPLKNQNKNEVR